ncbi:feruloyl esterase [Pyricularia oryzae 70-15]|uniref:Carboxylic ester hydrolase n=3 Tax=Pyricularia oryzae TaxID=318829 RepID=G4NAG3_PYRO7|nr:feruloyl esterase [Pyricularia oryzae 70-15]EHA51301.1 feruloyl esterase [Pyricularia oryzae 70-15]ELQ35533.1 feruloyl esterase [Pyricularia oryzae Y34]KAI7912120.1 feruloyl esterase [Pyricularia oryzae]KAI7913201.1 feruloyl esterase [Pyricularia oryzae]
MRSLRTVFGFLCRAGILAAASLSSRSSSIEACSEFAASVSDLPVGSSISESAFVPANSITVEGTNNSLAFCRIYGQVAYRANNTVNFQLWLPSKDHYNGDFLVVGNGGLGGSMMEEWMMKHLHFGFAIAAGDSGHSVADNGGEVTARPGLDLPFMHDPDQLLAWIRNGVAIMTPTARHIADAFYRPQTTKKALFYGCSTGGAQAYALAQFHPELFDGIVSSCALDSFSRLMIAFLWSREKTKGKSELPLETLRMIRREVLDKCDALDGVVDGLVENPLACDFDYRSLACADPPGPPGPPGSPSRCLSPDQMKAVEALSQGPKDARTNATIYPGFPVSTETEWDLQPAWLVNIFATPLMQNLVFKNLTWNPDTFDFGQDVDRVQSEAGAFIDSVSPDLSAFRKAGGKMIAVQSWADPMVGAFHAIDKLKAVEEKLGNGQGVGDFYRLFMVPGGGHCTSARTYPQVPGNWHSIEALADWVRSGKPPEKMLGTDPADASKKGKTMKLCPWPKTAKFVGGDPDEWSSFNCE